MVKKEDFIINVGLDFPDVFGFWEVNELIIAATSFMVFILIREILFGLSVCICILYFMHKLKDHSLRGRQDHFLWSVGLISKKGFESFPPAAAVRFEE